MTKPTHFKMVFGGADVFTSEACEKCGKLHVTKVNHYFGPTKAEGIAKHRAKLAETMQEVPAELCKCEREEVEEIEEEEDEED